MLRAVLCPSRRSRRSSEPSPGLVTRDGERPSPALCRWGPLLYAICTFIAFRQLSSLVARGRSAGLSGYFVGSSQDQTGGRHSPLSPAPVPAALLSPSDPIERHRPPDPGLPRATFPGLPRRQAPPLAPPRSSSVPGAGRAAVEAQPTPPVMGMPPRWSTPHTCCTAPTMTRLRQSERLDRWSTKQAHVFKQVRSTERGETGEDWAEKMAL